MAAAENKNRVLLVCKWRHGSHVDGQEQKRFSPLGTKLHFHVNSYVVLITNMATLSRGCKPRTYLAQDEKWIVRRIPIC